VTAASVEFRTAAELLSLCARDGSSIAELTLRREARERGETRESLLDRMSQHLRVMRESVASGLGIEAPSPSGLSGGDARKLLAYAAGPRPMLGAGLAKTLAYGCAVLECNAQFGRIVATPTAGSSGIVPACLLRLQEESGMDDSRLTMALFTAAGIGIVIGTNACFSGAQGGCQAEVGSASAMAAAALVEAQDGSPAQACDAAAFALMNALGLVCDPVGGYVEIPCVHRNGLFAVHSFQAAILALAGVPCRIPLDDVILALRDIGRRLPRELKETSLGGLAITPAARAACVAGKGCPPRT
jgi:L-serine dehydratase